MALDPDALNFLIDFLSTPAPARSETPAAAAFEAYADAFATVTGDTTGNRVARRGASQQPARVAICGHLDEVGLSVTEIDERGFLRFATIGSWDPSVLVGQRVLVCGRDGQLVEGAVGRPGIHVLRATGAEQHAPKVEDLWIDLAVGDRAEAASLVDVGAPAVLAGAPRLIRDHLQSRCLDNRVGTFIALEVLRTLPDDVASEVVVVATVQEEVGGAGARAIAPELGAEAVVVVDLAPSSDTPVGHPVHTLELGRGPGLNAGVANDAELVAELRDAATSAGIAVQQRELTSKSSTDVDRFAAVTPDVPAALVSLPVRYAHTPIELVALSDIEATVDLLRAWAVARVRGARD